MTLLPIMANIVLHHTNHLIGTKTENEKKVTFIEYGCNCVTTNPNHLMLDR
jgi:hypothetical protein